MSEHRKVDSDMGKTFNVELSKKTSIHFVTPVLTSGLPFESNPYSHTNDEKYKLYRDC
jgi:hypothetical protein